MAVDTVNAVVNDEIINLRQTQQQRIRTQAGVGAFTTSGYTIAVVFDAAFSAVPVVVASTVNAGNSTDGIATCVSAITARGFNATRNGSGGASAATFNWVAIGPA